MLAFQRKFSPAFEDGTNDDDVEGKSSENQKSTIIEYRKMLRDFLKNLYEKYFKTFLKVFLCVSDTYVL